MENIQRRSFLKAGVAAGTLARLAPAVVAEEAKKSNVVVA